MMENDIVKSEGEEPKRKITLRRTRTLEQPAFNSRKLAQDLYYRNKGESPLLRSVATLQNGSKQPVHQRLGVKSANKRITLRRTTKGSVTNTLTSRNVVHLKRTNVRNGFASTKTLIRRRQSANQRLIKIRQQAGMQNMVEGLNTQKIRLRRRRPINSGNPTNFVVQVANTNYRAQQNFSSFNQMHSVRNSLDVEIQNQIRVIQSQDTFNHEINRISPQPLFVPGYGVTCIPFHERFSRLP